MGLYGWICLVFFLSGLVQGLSGFGGVLLSIPLLVVFLDIKTVIPLVALAGLTLSTLLLVQLRHHLQWNKIYPLLVGALPGVPVGALFLKHMDKSIIQGVLGVILAAYAVWGLFLGSRLRGIGQGWAYPFGFAAGCLGGALSASGPAVIVFTSLTRWTKDRIKATLQGFFVLSGLVVVSVHAATGLTTGSVLKLYALSLPVLLAGTFLGSMLYGRLPEEQYRKLMLVLLGLLGIFLLLRA